MPEKFRENEAFIWPALIILRKARENQSSLQLVQTVREGLNRSRLLEHEDFPPNRTKSPAHVQEVLNWLGAMWQRLGSAEPSEILFRRQAITSEIVRSRLSAEEQVNLLTAVDYLSRLAAARKVAQSTRGAAAKIPFTQSTLMQAAYRKLTSLAATDLPIWLVGEKGTELEWMARLVHRLRGLPEVNFRVWEHSAPRRDVDSGSQSALDDSVHSGHEFTLFAPAMDEAPEAAQRPLYRHLINDLSRSHRCGTIVASRPAEYEEATGSSTFAELSAFLGPGRVEIPPLRRRIEDIPALIGFFAAASGLKDPAGRFTDRAIHELQAYHWPRNVEELEMVTAFALRMRPGGPIRPEDLPETVRRPLGLDKGTLEALEEIAVQGKFRVLRTHEGRRRLAAFLWEHIADNFKAGDIQAIFRMGRETARRLLLALESKGLIEPIKGAGGKRTTRYCCSRALDKR